MEPLGRGVVALRSTTTDVVIGWRVLGTDPPDVSFNVYRATGGGAPVKLNASPITGATQFWKIKLPLILPSIGIISILTFVGNFNAFDLIYSAQSALAGPNFSTDILGTLLYRTFFGFQTQLGDKNLGATIATMMFFIILSGVCLYLFLIQTRLRRYQF